MLRNIDFTLTHWLNSPAGDHFLFDEFMIATTKFTIPLMVVAVALRWWVREDA